MLVCRQWLAVVALMLVSCVAAADSMGALVVSGLGGDPTYDAEFVEYADQVAGALGSLATDKSAVSVEHAPSRETLLSAIDQLSSAQPDLFVLVLIGHGTADSETYRFNLPGKDPTTEDLVSALAGVDSPRQLVIVATSASGALVETLSQPGRVVATATRSGSETNLVRFPRFMAEAMSGSQADYDRNEILTLAEVWRYTNAAVEEYYETESLLATEHAVLSGEGSNEISLALLGALATSTENPEVIRLLDQRLGLESAFAALKQRKSEMSRSDYYTELEQLLLQIARLQIRIDAASGWRESQESQG